MPTMIDKRLLKLCLVLLMLPAGSGLAKAQEVSNDRFQLSPLRIQYGVGSLRLEGMGGFLIAVPDENNEINLIVNTTEGKQAIRESHSIRAAAVQKKVTYYTTLAAAIATCLALDHLEGGEVNKLQTLHKEVAA